ncbi:hypothetical protein AQUCO_01300397v1 [Aquilegia coerulea]|uniref:Uncharacterized protein n=1 Tax=Aquilegia coerulea TaxID=218851 RepID=A0A2G5E207_AQUCA|nr:hypothetical protein AQUCO_01300397v1 [Aquilegia coerulea]
MYYGVGSYRRTFLSRREYEEIIERCMQHIDSEIVKHQQPALYQWEEIISHRWWKLPQTPPSSDPVKDPLEDWWKEMEMSIDAHTFLKKNKSDVEGADKSNVDDGQPCQHDYVLNEEIGTICRICRSVGTEMRNILPPFLEKSGRRRRMEYNQTNIDGRHADDLELNFSEKDDSLRNASIHRESGSVWALIPDLQDKLHSHQKNAFEFVWMNIAGSLNPADMDFSLGRTGGCVISHSPGAGKTLLMISFLLSYLKLFPGGRPLILAPKTTMHTWYKEINKWEVSVPVYQIHSRRSYRKELRKIRMGASPGHFKLNMNVKHAVDCLEKFEKWHKHTSILLMTYPSFQAIMRGNSADKHLSYMAKVLRQSPGLLILDEGHNPRSTNSILRKTLMQVKTEKRILLSGTLFQNNFGEYFNTLSLARPSFITKVLRILAPDSRRHYIKDRLRTSKEAIARKFFVEKIGNRIKSKVGEERKKGLEILHKISSDFIDVYEGGISDQLPGLKSYKLLIKPSLVQQTFLEKIQKEDSCKRFCLELELLISFISIHPCLVKFVVDLVQRCIIKREKVLIFCRNLAPIRLLVNIFEKRFQWRKDDQVLVLNGEQEFLERSKVIDKFEEPGGSSQVLVASISACSEGISLIAASRVVFLDSEWNPSKTKQAVARAFRPGQKKVVYVYQLLASGTLEEDKHGRNTLKERISRMIFVGSAMEDSSCKQTENIDDDVLMDIMEEDHGQLIHRITKDEELSGLLGEVKNLRCFPLSSQSLISV